MGANESVKNENFPGTEECKRSYTLLHGHSGPVYSVAFRHSGDFLLSTSSDSTSKICLGSSKHYLFISCPNILNCCPICLTSVRLWNTKLNVNLVCYKGHNFPVWDAQVRFFFSYLQRKILIPFLTSFKLIHFYSHMFGYLLIWFFLLVSSKIIWNWKLSACLWEN